MSDDVLVRVENVSKRFCRSLKRSLWSGLQDAAMAGEADEFWAVKDGSFPDATHTTSGVLNGQIPKRTGGTSP
ncbi:MAG: hypothetical protein KFB97_04655 [Cyanobium sp. M30B3]|jgi:hypothetical protein|nr:MAG: hypothetical protein KFB97_04655 [Cyanobium sp. M30B3]